MDPALQDITAPAAPTGVYDIGGRRFAAGTPEFGEAVAEAHAARERPRCLCRPGDDGRGIEMYVARLAGTQAAYIVKRMPETGSRHAPQCPSYEPPAEFSGLGQVLGSAISEDPATGETTLKLDFALSRMPGRSQVPPAGGESDSVATSGTKLSLRGLLHYLWDQAELTRWHPGFAGKRNWATVRRHLLQAAESKFAKGDPLRERLYVPEPFSVEEREGINARRLAQWQRAAAVPGKPQQLMLLVGEVKEIVPARYGYHAVIKHVPDQGFSVDEGLYRRLGRRFAEELALWGAADDLQMVMIGTFAVSAAGVPAIQELSLMPVTRHWIPVEDGFAWHLVERLVGEGRSFIKGLRYNLGCDDEAACALLTDCEGPPVALHVQRETGERQDAFGPTGLQDGRWEWCSALGPMPALPARARLRRAVL